MLCNMGHVLTDNRHGLLVNAQVTHAIGKAKRARSAQMLAGPARVDGTSITVGTVEKLRYVVLRGNVRRE
ncbi:hypothetical protein BTHE68_40440 [Burkholderia sp. THE68]|nr:hypothetical protein BTHE68_40440 [Burkholderia sp. THE68]